MFFHKKKSKKTYDKETPLQILRCSTCNGERMAGFKEISTGKFQEVTLIEMNQIIDEYEILHGIWGIFLKI